LHAKTGDTKHNPTKSVLSSEQKDRLFKAAASVIPVGDKLSSWGTVTKGGFHAMNRFSDLGFTKVGERDVVDTNGNSAKLPIMRKDASINTVEYP
jgi:hypothetical protein